MTQMGGTGRRVSVVAPWYGATAHLVLGFEIAVVGFDEVVIVDDGCDAATQYELERAAVRNGWAVLENERNLGFAGASNRGYARSTGEIVLFLNSDVLAPRPGLVDAVRQDVSENVLAGPSVFQQVVYGLGVPYVEGWCVAATRSTWSCLILGGNDGPWDAVSFPMIYWEDNDLSFRAMGLGIQLQSTKWVNEKLIEHKCAGTTGPAFRHGDSFETNRAVFANRVLTTWNRIRNEKKIF